MSRLNFSNTIFATAASLAVLAASLLGAVGGDGDTVSFTEYHIKALFIYNFAKYVDWPADAFPQPGAPITIGVLGRNDFGGDLQTVVAGKSINGRQLVILQIEKESDWSKCQILFISAPDDERIAEILSKIKGLPILTVGESASFVQQGGIIHFIVKDEKVRLEINLQAARQAKLQISSKLLSVADIVNAKPD